MRNTETECSRISAQGLSTQRKTAPNCEGDSRTRWECGYIVKIPQPIRKVTPRKKPTKATSVAIGFFVVQFCATEKELLFEDRTLNQLR